MNIRAPVNSLNTLKLIVMSLGQLTLACRIETVYKIVNRSQIHSSGLGYTGLTHIGEHTAVVIDLHRKLFNTPLADEPGYFVLIKPQTGDLLAIPVITSPNLMDIQHKQIRALPDPYRQSDTLNIASHVAVIPHKDKHLTIFVIDENSLI
ncbi:chemotaxis protein [Leptolyngbya sp. Heron Island J]|uniref:chemotaxis protein n=1 Tax=Leptolyngbya sp. Heron Island J TaxID=1385935 RepID=UPI0003B96DEF|nr:chemotaxis protein [Leptolyngbya sp. Heron Island J]ESA35452.1 chemotaxis protein [Leptolyngbya sp. Heron Island J]